MSSDIDHRPLYVSTFILCELVCRSFLFIFMHNIYFHIVQSFPGGLGLNVFEVFDHHHIFVLEISSLWSDTYSMQCDGGSDREKCLSVTIDVTGYCCLFLLYPLTVRRFILYCLLWRISSQTCANSNLLYRLGRMHELETESRTMANLSRWLEITSLTTFELLVEISADLLSGIASEEPVVGRDRR
jgi:hypothetical protein